MPTKKPSSKVTFGDPPTPRVRRYDWAAIAEKVRARPGEWALVFEQDRTSLVTSLRVHGIKDLLRADGFEYRTANNKTTADPPVCDLWIRWNPPTKKGK